MSNSSRRESLARLELLGGLSDCYSEVASVNGRSDAGADDDWDAHSTSSHASTEVVVFDKAPPPHLSMRKPERRLHTEARRRSTTSDVDTYSSSPNFRVEPKSQFLANTLQQARAEKRASAAVPNKVEPKPTRGLRRTRHPTIMRPGSAAAFAPDNEHRSTRISTHPNSASIGVAFSDYGGSQPVDMRPSWVPFKPLYKQSKVERPVSVYAPYQPPRREHDQNKPALQRQQSFNMYGVPLRDDTGDDDMQSQYSTATYSHAPRAVHPPTRSTVQSSRVSQITRHRDSQVYCSNAPEVVSHTPLHPHPHPPPAAPSSTRGRKSSRASQYSPSASPVKRTPSPSQGAWSSDNPRQKRASFIDRCTDKVEKEWNTHMIKAGRRPRPSFEVKSVWCRSPVDWDARSPASSAPSPSPSPARSPSAVPGPMTVSSSSAATRRDPPRQRPRSRAVISQPTSPVEFRKLQTPCELPASPIPIPPPRNPRRLLDVGKAPAQNNNNNKKKSDELFGAPLHHRASGLFEPAWTTTTTTATGGMTASPKRTGTPDLRINTNVAMEPVELPTPYNDEPYYSHHHHHHHHDHRPASSQSHSPQSNTPPDFSSSSSSSSDAGLERSDSLFLGGNGGGKKNNNKTLPSPASYSFFAPAWSQHEMMAMEMTARQQQQHSRSSRSRPSTRLAAAASSSSSCVGGEQLDLAPGAAAAAAAHQPLSTSSPVEIGDDDDGDDRRRLPSQNKKQKQKKQEQRRLAQSRAGEYRDEEEEGQQQRMQRAHPSYNGGGEPRGLSRKKALRSLR
ncbi:hypothetical protein F4778DRAFT_222806 [Xylariomycetidae sp. FL2044]|nr:hypothetical protein F4778DRAFT_222806 [Xylariomycetidae sp. FL2044]